jgi:cytochrome c
VRLSVPIAGEEGRSAATKAAAAAASPITTAPGAKATGSSAPSAAPSPEASGQGGTQGQAGSAPQALSQPQAAPPDQSQGSAGSAQTAAPEQAASAPQASDLTGANAQGTPFFVSARDLLGVVVLDHENRAHSLGWVGNLVLDRSTGRIQYVILESGGFLGWDRNRIVVPYNLLAFGGRWDRPTLLVPASKIENAPRIRESDLVDLMGDADWRRAIAVYFGTDLTDRASASGASDASATSGPRPLAAGTPAGSDEAGHASDPKAQPGEGATGPTASSGHPSASATTTALATPDTAGTADPKHGQAVVQRTCAACHTFNQGGPTRVGPNLFGVTERQIAEVPGYNYSPALKSHQGQHWDQGGLDAFLKSPRTFAPGTRMTFPGIGSDQDRRDVIAYLESLKAGTGASK